MEPFGTSVQDALEFEPKPKQLQVQEQANIISIICLLAHRETMGSNKPP